MTQAVNKTDPQQYNPSSLDGDYDDSGDGLDAGDPSDGGSDFDNGLSNFQGQAPTRAEVLKLFERAQGRPDEKKVDQVLREVLNDLLAGDQQKASEDYQAIPDDLLQPPEEDSNTGDANGNKPNRTEDLPGYGKTEIYDDLKVKDYNFTPDFKKGEVKTHKIFSNGGKVVINGTTSQDTAEVKKLADGTYEIKIHKDGLTDDENTETFIVDGPPQSIVINTVAKNIQSQLPQDDTVVQLGTGADSNNVNWPGAALVISNLPAGGEGSKEAQELLTKIDAAMNSNDTGKWKEVIDYLGTLWPSHEHNENPPIMGGAVLRKVMTALYKTVGSNDQKLKNLLSKMDPGFRREMVRCLDHFATGTNIYRMGSGGGFGSPAPDNSPDPFYGADSKSEGDQWGNAATRDIISAAPQNPVAGSNDPGDE